MSNRQNKRKIKSEIVLSMIYDNFTLELCNAIVVTIQNTNHFETLLCKQSTTWLWKKPRSDDNREWRIQKFYSTTISYFL